MGSSSSKPKDKGKKQAQPENYDALNVKERAGMVKMQEEGTHKLRTLPHMKARATPYQGGGPRRTPVAQANIPWDVPWGEYAAVEYTSPVVLKQPPWADPTDVSEVTFNTIDASNNVDRTSFEGAYTLDATNNRPLNPRGRTGMTGRGLLGRFGPNHAADPIITKWARSEGGEYEVDSRGRKVLEFVAIQRRDTQEWAIPGGMVDAGENVSLTLKREFGEETMNSLAMNEQETKEMEKNLNEAFTGGVAVYNGYVDDIRNTDNAWMETTCVNFHDGNGKSFSKFKLNPGDDAGQVKWTKFTPGMPLYATHSKFLEIVAAMHGVLDISNL